MTCHTICSVTLRYWVPCPATDLLSNMTYVDLLGTVTYTDLRVNMTCN